MDVMVNIVAQYVLNVTAKGYLIGTKRKRSVQAYLIGSPPEGVMPAMV